MSDQLGPEDRLRLMRFACSFIWADLEVGRDEEDFVARLADGLQLTADERAQAEAWLRKPPSADELDPQEIPPEHAELLLIVVRAAIGSDGTLASKEKENLVLLEQLLLGDDRTEEWGGPLLTEEINLN